MKIRWVCGVRSVRDLLVRNSGRKYYDIECREGGGVRGDLDTACYPRESIDEVYVKMQYFTTKAAAEARLVEIARTHRNGGWMPFVIARKVP